MDRAILTDARVERYSRQIVLAGVSAARQAALLDACVEVASAKGPLENAARVCALYLGLAGVGRLATDSDDSSALTRTLASRTPDVRVEPFPASAAAVRIAFAPSAVPAPGDALVLVGSASGSRARCLRVPPFEAASESPLRGETPTPSAALALGLWVAVETLRFLLDPGPVSRAAIEMDPRSLHLAVIDPPHGAG